MSITHHRRSDFGSPHVCLWDQEDWPCEYVQSIDQYSDELEAEIERIAGTGPYTAGILAVVKQAMENLSPME